MKKERSAKTWSRFSNRSPGPSPTTAKGCDNIQEGLTVHWSPPESIYGVLVQSVKTVDRKGPTMVDGDSPHQSRRAQLDPGLIQDEFSHLHQKVQTQGDHGNLRIETQEVMSSWMEAGGEGAPAAHSDPARCCWTRNLQHHLKTHVMLKDTPEFTWTPTMLFALILNAHHALGHTPACKTTPTTRWSHS